MKDPSRPPSSFRFLGWDLPLLDSAADFLMRDAQDSRPVDLSSRLVIVSSRQAGRRLRQALAARAAANGSGLLAPRVTTPEYLLSHERCPDLPPPPSHAALAALWIRALRSARLAEFPSLFPSLPNAPDFAWASAVAATLIDLHILLSETGLHIGDAAKVLRKQGIETERWKDLSALDNLFLKQLARAGFSSPTAIRIAAARSQTLPPGVTSVYVLAVPDLPPLALEALAHLSESVPVHVAVFAPESHAEGISAWGQPLPGYWTHHDIPLPDQQTTVRTHASPSSELAEACRLLGNATGHVAAGIADPELAAPLQERLAESGIATFDPAGRPFRRSALHHLLEMLRDLAGGARAEAVAALVRIPAVLDHFEAELSQEGVPFEHVRLFSELDGIRKDHLPETLANIQNFAGRSAGPELRFVLRRLNQWRSELRSIPFPQALQSVLSEIFLDRRQNSLSDPGLEDLASRLGSLLNTLATQPHCLEGLSAAEQFSLVLQSVSREVSFGEGSDSDLDLSGWLELPWENAPQLVLAGFHDRCVPESISSHVYLPDKTRSLLGLRDNEHRHARDALLLSGILATRPQPGSVRLSFSQFNLAGDPQKPSRLLFQCPDSELAERAAQLFRAAPDQAVRSSLAWTRAWLLRPRRLPSDHPIFQIMSVTGFSSYLDCPFRYYLKYGLGMEDYPLGKREMDPREFGSLCHYALEGLGSEPGLVHCTDAEPLREFFCARAEAWVAQQYGKRPTLPVRIQLEAARQRLFHAADLLAQQRRDGWILERVEWRIHGEKPWRIHDMEIRGKIDRVERHEKTGSLRVLDCKTSTTPTAPDDAHVRTTRKASDAAGAAAWLAAPSAKGTGRWINLQLPLYCLALRQQLDFAGPITCGYINLPRAVSDSAVLTWDTLSHETLASAVRCAEGVIDAIRSGVFWPPAERPEHDDFEGLFFGSAEAAIDPGSRPLAIAP